jgi:hypothetical protein
MAGGTFSYYNDNLILGWNFDTKEKLLETFKSRYGTYFAENDLDIYKTLYDTNLKKIETETNAKLNLGGENDKAKIEFSDKPIGVFDFSLASQQLFRVQEFFSEEIKQNDPFLFKSYDLPSGVIPNYFVTKQVENNITNFYYIDEIKNIKYLLEKRQKGLTKILHEDPLLKVSVLNGMLIPKTPVKGVVFSSKTKKPYVKYKKRGGKVKYVEIYSIFYYSKMKSDFSKSIRHLPAVMVCEYLEKMGTLTKFFLTRFVQQPALRVQNPREFDITTGKELPLYNCELLRKKEGKGRFDEQLVIQPLCVKEYGEIIDKSFVYGASGTREKLYESTFSEMIEQETTNGNNHAYGNPDFDEPQYQEGFERFRQKYLTYTQLGIWKAKEVTAQGLIYYHDLYLNREWANKIYDLITITKLKHTNYENDWYSADLIEKEAFLISYSPENTKWFEIWITISANTIRHKLDIFNSNNPRKTYQLIFKDLQDLNDEILQLIKNEKFPKLKSFFEDWYEQAEERYTLNNPKQYCVNRIDEMTFYAKGGCFPTPDEDIETRNLEAQRLRDELKKM